MVQLQALQDAITELSAAVQTAITEIGTLKSELESSQSDQATIDQLTQTSYDLTNQLTDAAGGGDQPTGDQPTGGQPTGGQPTAPTGPTPQPARPPARPPATPPAGPPVRPAPPSGRRVGGT